MATNATDFYPNATMTTSECLVLRVQQFISWNNSDVIVSAHTRSVVRTVNFLSVPVTAVIGVPANVINMAVFYKQGLEKRINVCLFTLSLADCLFLTTCMMCAGEQIHLLFTTNETFGPVVQWLTNNHFIMFSGLSWVSQILSAIVASERCFCILQPLKSQVVLHTKTMTMIIAAIFVMFIGLKFLTTFRHYITCAFNPASESFILVAIGSEFYYKNRTLIDFVDIVLLGLGLPWLAILVVIVTTVVTVIKLRQAAEWRTVTSSRSENMSAQDLALTRMLVGSSVLFIICVLPVCLFRVSQLFLPEMNPGRQQVNLYALGLSVSHIFTYINSTFNFVVYCVMGSRYRHTVCSLLQRKGPRLEVKD